MLSLSKTQLDFLDTEFGVDAKTIELVDRDRWNLIRDECIGIVVEETAYDGEFGEPSERFLMAESIADVTYSKLQHRNR